ncbi:MULTISPECIES: GNAT family N-acetyltransferase [unclassified Veillonella]|uniref:GNAT family N-acetyltransferase n=1 Tax=unclassified Veillonella TaxID=2630086 RepID=UPI000F8CDB9C|nr:MULTISPECIES: GNAT family N-acetyltransferase [unclassified Veillonella]
MWKITKLHELSPLELFEIFRLRVDTFVVEQNRVYHECDDVDLKAAHVLYWNEKTNQVDAYARIFEENGIIVFGRVVTRHSTRGLGMGRQLVQHIMNYIHEHWNGKNVAIEAQEQVVGLYEKFGFKTEGESFIHEGTPHVKMVYTPK